MSYLASLRAHQKMDPKLDGGDKYLLRVLAQHMGLIKTAMEPKRAIQFGSRSAKLYDKSQAGRRSGTDRVVA